MNEKKQPFNFSYLFLSSWRPYAWIAFVGFVLFFRTFFYQLTYYDDDIWLINSQWFFERWSHIFQFFVRPDFVADYFYRPVFHLFFMFESKMYGEALWGYRLTNILLHVANSGLVFYLFKRLKYDSLLAFGFALIFVAHPSLTMAVAWIPGRTETTWSLFFLLSFVSFLNFLDHRQKRYCIGHLIFFTLALFTKETAIVIPLVVGFYFYFLNDQPKFSLKRSWMIYAWLVIIFLWWLMRSYALTGTEKIPLIVLAESFVGNTPSLLIHLGKALYPFNLCVTPILEDTSLFFGSLALSTVCLLVWAAPVQRKKYLLFGVFWFFIFLLPGLLVSWIFFEYRIYLSLIGLMIVVMETDFIQRLLVKRKKIVLFIILSVAFFSSFTFQYVGRFKDHWTFWKSSIKCSSHLPVAYTNLGRLYQVDQQLDQAKRHFAKALLLFPRMVTVRRNLGDIYVQEGRFEEAEREYAQEIFFNPAEIETYGNFALLRYQQGRDEEARALLDRALEIKPDYIKAYLLFIFDYVRQGDKEKIEHYVRELERRGFNVPMNLFSLQF